MLEVQNPYSDIMNTLRTEATQSVNMFETIHDALSSEVGVHSQYMIRALSFERRIFVF